ncbi:N-acylphosphatidylethanolamine synthase isoform X1 [Tanacetum coccineum]
MSIQGIKDLKQEYLDKMKSLINEFPIKYVVGSAGTNSNSNVVTGTFLLNNRYASILFDTGADRSFISTAFSSLIDIIPTTLDHGYDDEEYTIAIIPVLLTKEPDNSLSMGDEHLSTFLETESNELIKSSVENFVPIPSESEDFSDIESECDVPVCDNFTTFSNHLFDADDDFSSSDDESFSDEDVPKEIYSTPLFDEEIISSKIDPHHFNAEPDLIESMLNRDTLIISSPKFDSLLEEFLGELAHINLIPLGINEADFDPEEEIHHVEKLLYENSSPRPPEEFNSENSDAIIESFSSSPIPVEDSDSLMEEIDLFLTPNDSMPPGIENDDYDSEGDIFFLEELLSNDSPSLHKNESFHFDVPSSPRPPTKRRMMEFTSSPIRDF